MPLHPRLPISVSQSRLQTPNQTDVLMFGCFCAACSLHIAGVRSESPHCIRLSVRCYVSTTATCRADDGRAGSSIQTTTLIARGQYTRLGRAMVPTALKQQQINPRTGTSPSPHQWRRASPRLSRSHLRLQPTPSHTGAKGVALAQTRP